MRHEHEGPASASTVRDRVLAPRPPEMTSWPPRPAIMSPPPRPQMTSFPGVPTSLSGRLVPVIVHATGLHAGSRVCRATRIGHGRPGRMTIVSISCGILREKAIWPPSGDQAGSDADIASGVMKCFPDPSRFMTMIRSIVTRRVASYDRSNATRPPSGDHVGLKSCVPPVLCAATATSTPASRCRLGARPGSGCRDRPAGSPGMRSGARPATRPDRSRERRPCS